MFSRCAARADHGAGLERLRRQRTPGKQGETAMHSDDERFPRAGFSKNGGNSNTPTLMTLFPVSVISTGALAQPAERLMDLQSGFSRLVVLLTSFRWSRPSLPRRRPRALRIQ
jgi:hypothetical protein